MTSHRLPLFTFALAILAGTFSPARAEEAKDRERLKAALGWYEDGLYQKTADSLTALLPQLSDLDDELQSYKYLGFSYAMLNRIDTAKGIFKTALQKFPSMSIDTLEVPPNIALVFKQARLEKKLEAIASAPVRPVPAIARKKNTVLPSVLLAGGVAGLGVGAYFFYSGYQSYSSYRSFSKPDQGRLDAYYSMSRNYFIAGAACSCVAAVLVPVSIYLFARKEIRPAPLSVSLVNGSPRLMFSF
ncbi:MAG TPA: hypothetical protein VLX68_14645 [Chitinivibrionales bacterium]|nr:hypothetical protein [Chitinivibrionales bacterium]